MINSPMEQFFYLINEELFLFLNKCLNLVFFLLGRGRLLESFNFDYFILNYYLFFIINIFFICVFIIRFTNKKMIFYQQLIYDIAKNIGNNNINVNKGIYNFIIYMIFLILLFMNISSIFPLSLTVPSLPNFTFFLSIMVFGGANIIGG
jgi:F0F1-type ATP synthase membrane subunit a